MTAPISLKPGEERLARIDAYAEKASMSRHAAILRLIDLGLEPEAVPTPAAALVAKVPGLKTANQIAEEGMTTSEAMRRYEAKKEADRIFASKMFSPKGKKS